MIRLSLLFVAAGIAALIVAQVASRPPPPRFQNADLVGSWVTHEGAKCGPDEPAVLTVTEDGWATVNSVAYSVSGRLLPTEGVRDYPFRARTFTFLRLLDAVGNRWQFLLDSKHKLTVLENPFTYRQAPTGAFMVMRRLPRIYRCS